MIDFNQNFTKIHLLHKKRSSKSKVREGLQSIKRKIIDTVENEFKVEKTY